MQFIAGIADGGQSFHRRLRVKRVQGHPGVWEMTWAPDGREAALARQPWPSLVYRRLGSSQGGLAHLPHRPPDQPRVDRRGLHAAQPAGKRSRSIRRAGIKRAPSRFEARVTLHAAAEEISGRVPTHFGTIEPIDAHTCEYQTSDDDLRWLAMRIAMLGVDFEVHEPPELLEHLRTLT